MDFQLDNDIPVAAIERTGRTKYPFNDMEVGQSFFAAGDAARGAVTKFHADNKDVEGSPRFVTRARTEEVDDEEVEGIRVWRTE